MQNAEVGVEHLAFGLRWKKEAEKNRSRTDQHLGRAVDLQHPVRHLDKDQNLKKIATIDKQPPLMPADDDNELYRLKGNIVKLYKRERESQEKRLKMEGPYPVTRRTTSLTFVTTRIWLSSRPIRAKALL